MKASTIGRLHRVLGLGMDPRAVAELAGDHVESDVRRHGLRTKEHAEFLLNSVVRRINTSPAMDFGAHFLPALLLTGLGIAVYLAGGSSAAPSGSPSWPVGVVAVGVVWLVVAASRVRGFPTHRALAPISVLSMGVLLDALVMPIVLPEDQCIRFGMLVMGVTCPVVFLRLRSHGPHDLSWVQVRLAILADRLLRLAWRTLAVGLAVIAVGEVAALSRHELPNGLQIGAVISGAGLAWMARSFHAAARQPKAC